MLFGTKILNSMYRFFHFKNRLLNGREAASSLVLIRLFQQTTSCSVRGASPDVSENLARISVAVLH
jgi:hypothetical protein